jgi:hypothetical protein
LIPPSANVIAVVQLTGRCSLSVCYDNQKGVRHASKDQTAICNHLKSLRDVLERLLELAKSEAEKGSSRLSTLESLVKPDGPLSKCEAELTALMKKLKPASGWKAVGKGLAWPLKESDVNKCLDNLERTKETLNLALSADQT